MLAGRGRILGQLHRRRLGAKSQRAKELYEQGYGALPDKPFPLKTETVTRLDENELVAIPAKPEDKAKLEYFGYESLKEMFAERGHVSQRCLEKLNPEIVDWTQVHAGDRIRIPDFAAAGVKAGGKATLLRVSLKRCEIIAYDGEGKVVAFFPCSIAASKQNLPPEGEPVDRLARRKPQLHLHARLRAGGRKGPAPYFRTRPQQSGGDRVDRARSARLRHPRHARPRTRGQRRIARVLPPRQLERAQGSTG